MADTSETQTSGVVTTSTTSSSDDFKAPAPKKPKKPRTPAQLEALAKGPKAAAQAKRQKRSTAAVVKDDDSADELVERVRNSDSEATVTHERIKRKRSESFLGNGLGETLGGSTTVKVLGVAAVAGLCFLGSRMGGLKGPPSVSGVNTPSNQGSQAPSGGNTIPLSANLGVPLSSTVYYA
jgi:hypothetical protein